MTENLRGILLMVAAMAVFAVEDVFIKLVSATLPPGQILLAVGLAGTPVFALGVRRQGGRFRAPALAHPAVLLRNLGEVSGTFGFITALALTPLSSATAIFQAAPLAMTLGAALFLGERVGWRRLLAILAGFVGVMIIIRPGGEAFQPASLWSILAVLGLTLRDLATRRVPRQVSTMQLSAWGFACLIPLGAGMLAVSGGAVVPGPAQTLMLGVAIACGIGGYWLVTAASRVGEIAAVTPFRYSRLVFAMIFALTVFGERPDAATLAGTALILGSGLYTFARERRLRRTLASAAAPR